MSGVISTLINLYLTLSYDRLLSGLSAVLTDYETVVRAPTGLQGWLHAFSWGWAGGDLGVARPQLEFRLLCCFSAVLRAVVSN